MSALKEGDRISNYLLEARVGGGSFGEVWRARHHVFGDRVAIKIPTDAQFVRNLQREGLAIHGLRHPNIVRAIDLDPYGEPPYLVMDFIDGPSLREAIDHYQGSFPMEAATVILRGILRALVAAHAGGLVHRDIKPANILLDHPLDTLEAIQEQAIKVTDFGLGQVGGDMARSIMQSGSLETSDGKSIAGTLAYMSPEQKQGKVLDGRSDLYACGVVLFEMLTGERPAGSELPGALRSGIPPVLDGIFRRCYSRWESRFDNAQAVLDALSDETKLHGSANRPAAVRSEGCPSCGSPVHADDQFCIQCGRQLANSIPRCGSCEAYVHRDDRFCILCGNDLRVLTR